MRPKTFSRLAYLLQRFQPVTNELKIGTHSEPITVETVSEEPTEDETKEEVKEQPTVQETFLRSAMEDTVQNGGSLPTIDVKDIVGRTFITTPDAEGEQFRAKIHEAEFLQQRTADEMQPLIRFHCRVGDKRFEEIMTYNRMLEWCDHDASSDKDDFFRLVAITGHREVNGVWQVRAKWASDLSSWEPLTKVFEDDPVTVSLYAKKHGLLQINGWKRCNRYAKREKVLGRMANQVRLKNYRNRPRYKYGYQVPRNHEEAVMIDEKNGNRKWQDSEELEKDQLLEYDTFLDLGKGSPVPEGYKKIPCHMVYDVKHDGRHKSRLVAGGHRTDTPVESTYSGVVSLLGV